VSDYSRATFACSTLSVSSPSGRRCPDIALEHHVLNCNGCVDAKPFLELNTATLEFGAFTSPYAPLAVAFNASHMEPIHGIGNHSSLYDSSPSESAAFPLHVSRFARLDSRELERAYLPCFC
jgi:hypothetical protein